jgi:hypothetical protein
VFDLIFVALDAVLVQPLLNSKMEDHSWSRHQFVRHAGISEQLAIPMNFKLTSPTGTSCEQAKILHSYLTVVQKLLAEGRHTALSLFDVFLQIVLLLSCTAPRETMAHFCKEQCLFVRETATSTRLPRGRMFDFEGEQVRCERSTPTLSPQTLRVLPCQSPVLFQAAALDCSRHWRVSGIPSFVK